MILSKSADFKALDDKPILQISVEEYLNAHLANKRINDRQSDKLKKRKR